MKSKGFTAVELLVALVIGMLFLLSAYQLYSFVLSDSTATRIRASASNVAYRFLREGAGDATPTCGNLGTTDYTSQIPASAGLPADTTASVTLSCVGNGTTVTYITSSITYGNPSRTVTHATYASGK